LGKGDGTFQAAVTYGSGANRARSVAVADVNGDGKPDLMVSNNGEDNGYGAVGVLLGKGDGTFRAAVNYAAGSAPQSVAIGDFNRDGKPDLVVDGEIGVSRFVCYLALGDGNGSVGRHGDLLRQGW